MIRLTLVRQLVRRSTALISRALLVAAKEIGADGALLSTGLSLLGYGAYLIYPPAGFIVPGLVLVWIAVPTRPGLIERLPALPAMKRQGKRRS